MLTPLNFGNGSWEDARGTVENTLSRLVNLIEGNGKEGMLTTLNNFIAEYRENRRSNIEFQEHRDAENAKRESRRWKAATLILTVFGVLLALLTYLEANRQIHGKFSLSNPDTVVSSVHKPQTADIPPLVK